MKVLVDTSVWSLALRRPKNLTLGVEHRAIVSALADLMRDGRAVMMGRFAKSYYVASKRRRSLTL